jgi:hypothetical protein
MNFDNEEKYRQSFIDAGMPPGRMIGWSKSGYVKLNPNTRPIFNARICILGEGIVWSGDLDLDKDNEKLEEIATSIGKNIFVLRESDAYFEASDEIINSRLIAKI